MRLGILLCCFFAFMMAMAQDSPAPPKVELKLDAKQAASGGTLKGKVLVTFEPGWHGYQNPPKSEYEIPLKVEASTKDLKLKATYPKGELKEFGGTPTLAYEGTVTIPIVLTLPKKSGEFPFKLEVSFQQCNESTCLPPGKVVVSDKVSLKKPAPAKPKKP